MNGSTTVVGDLPRALTLGHPAPDPRWIARSTYYAEVAAKAANAETVAHANLRGIRDDGECMSIVEASAIRDARALLGASVAKARHSAVSPFGYLTT